MNSLAAPLDLSQLRVDAFRCALLATWALLLPLTIASAAPMATTMAADEFRKPVVVADWGGCAPDELEPLGNCFGSDEPGEFSVPKAVAIDDEGFVYVSEPNNARTQKFAPGGALVAVWPGYAPREMKWGPDGVLWVVIGNTIRKWDRNGNDVGGFGQTGAGPGEFQVPRAIDFDAQGRAVVLDAGNNRVQRFTLDGQYIDEWPVTPHWIAWDRLSLLVLPDGSVLISDLHTPFEHFSADGTFLGKWAPFGTGKGQFRRPSSMTIGPDGNVYVVDRGNTRIQVMTPEGRYLGRWGERGNGEGQFLLPEDIALNGDFLYVTDQGNSIVRAYSFHSVVTTDPPGLPVLVDGKESVSPVVTDWAPGTQHQIEAIALPDADGVRREFAAWNDGGSVAHLVTAPVKPAAYTAAYDTYYWMEMSAEPGVTFTPGSQWVPEEEPVEIHGYGPDGYAVRWEGTGRGSYTGPFGGAYVRAKEPVTQHAVLEMSGSFVTLTISASDTDPFAQTDAPAGGVRQLHLWIACAAEGLSAFEAQTVGSLTPVAFVPAEGVVNAGTAEHLFLGIGGCPTGADVQRLLGTWYVDDAGGDLCLAETAEGVFAWATCDPVLPVVITDPELLGFSSSGAPCVVGSRGCPGPPAARLADTGAPAPALARAAVAVFGLAAPRPNPFRDRTTFLYTLPAPSDVRVSVFDVTGRLVRRLADGRLPGGAHAVDWDGRGGDSSPAPAGVYFVRLEADGRAETRKVTRLGVR